MLVDFCGRRWWAPVLPFYILVKANRSLTFDGINIRITMEFNNGPSYKLNMALSRIIFGQIRSRLMPRSLKPVNSR